MAQESYHPQRDLTADETPAPELEEIREQMDDTRAALSEKLGTLQEIVTDKVETAESTIERTVETVQRTFDLRYQVCQHPWVFMGASVATGYALGLWAMRSPARPQAAAPSSDGVTGNGRSHAEVADVAAPRSVTPTSRILAEFGEELETVKKTAIRAGTNLLCEWIERLVPALAPKAIEAKLEQWRSSARPSSDRAENACEPTSMSYPPTE